MTCWVLPGHTGLADAVSWLIDGPGATPPAIVPERASEVQFGDVASESEPMYHVKHHLCAWSLETGCLVE